MAAHETLLVFRLIRRIAYCAVFLVLVPLVILEAAFRFLPVSNPPYLYPVSAHDPVPHYQPNVDYRYSGGWNFAIRTHKRSNNYGYNHVADYQTAKSGPLLMVIGDSFVEAHAVDAGRSIAELLNGSVAGTGHVYSLGVSGAPLSEYLVFADFARQRFQPDAMAFVIIGNDFDESLLKYKSEPRFHYFDSEGKLTRVDYELPLAKRVLRESAFARYVVLNVGAERGVWTLRRLLTVDRRAVGESREAYEERVRDSERAVDWFLAQLPEKSGLPAGRILLVLDGVRPELYSPEGRGQADETYFGRMRRYLEAKARARGFAVLDLQPVFAERYDREGARFEFPIDSHWNELGHRVAAEAVRGSAVFLTLFGQPDTLREAQ